MIRSDIRYRLVGLFAENGIVIALPQRDVHVDNAVPIIDDTPARPPDAPGA